MIITSKVTYIYYVDKSKTLAFMAIDARCFGNVCVKIRELEAKKLKV